MCVKPKLKYSCPCTALSYTFNTTLANLKNNFDTVKFDILVTLMPVNLIN